MCENVNSMPVNRMKTMGLKVPVDDSSEERQLSSTRGKSDLDTRALILANNKELKALHYQAQMVVSTGSH